MASTNNVIWTGSEENGISEATLHVLIGRTFHEALKIEAADVQGVGIVSTAFVRRDSQWVKLVALDEIGGSAILGELGI